MGELGQGRREGHITGELRQCTKEVRLEIVFWESQNSPGQSEEGFQMRAQQVQRFRAGGSRTFCGTAGVPLCPESRGQQRGCLDRPGRDESR